MPVTRSAARREARAASSQPPEASPTAETQHTDPTLALHASLLVIKAKGPFPFSGEWPNIRWTQDVCEDTLSYIACKVLQPDPEYAKHPETAHERFSNGSKHTCLIAKRHANSVGLPAEPALLQGASWRILKGRWVVQLRLPERSEHEALMWEVIARFSPDGQLDKKHLTPQQQQMHDLLTQPMSSSKRVGYYCYLHRLLCWVTHGAPVDSDNITLLHHCIGDNNTLHMCDKEKPLCLATQHLRWGTAQENVDHKQMSKRARRKTRIKNLRRLAKDKARK